MFCDILYNSIHNAVFSYPFPSENSALFLQKEWWHNGLKSLECTEIRSAFSNHFTVVCWLTIYVLKGEPESQLHLDSETPKWKFLRMKLSVTRMEVFYIFVQNPSSTLVNGWGAFYSDQHSARCYSKHCLTNPSLHQKKKKVSTLKVIFFHSSVVKTCCHRNNWMSF